MERTTTRRFATGVVYGSALVQGLSVVSYPASAEVLKARLSDAEYGSIFLVQTLATLLGSSAGSRLGQRALGGSVLSAALVASAAAELLLWLAPQLGVAAALSGAFALGAGFGLAAAPLNGQPGRLFPARAAVALVALHTVLAAGFAIGPALVSAASAAGSWSIVPAAIGLMALVLAGLARMSLAEAGADAAPVADGGGRTQARGSFAFAVIVVLYALSEGTFANWCTIYLREERGVPAPLAASALSSFWCALALGRLAVSALLSRFSAESIWRCLPLGMIGAFLWLPAVQSAAAGIAVFGLAGLACSAFFPLSVSLAGQRDPAGAARAASQLTAALMLGVGVGSFAIGPLREGHSLAALYRASAVYPALALALCGWLTLRRPGRSPASSSNARADQRPSTSRM